MKAVHQPILNENVLLELILNNMTDGVFALDQNGAIVDANVALQTMLGWSRDELNSVRPPFIVNMTVEEHQLFLSKLKNGQSFPYEIVKRRHKDGTIQDILASYWPLKNDKIIAIGIYKDFTEQIRIQRKLKASEDCYRTLVENLPEAIVKLRNNKIVFVNSSAVKFLGKELSEQLIHHSIWEFISSNRQEELQRVIDSAYDGEVTVEPKQLTDQFSMLNQDKEMIAEVKIIPIGSIDEPDIQLVFQDITEMKRYEAQLEHLAYHDPLTGLYNRRIFEKIVTESIQSLNNKVEMNAFMYIDLDNFKTINDNCGHDVGDQLLQQVAERLKDCVPKGDIVSRVGGDEFLVFIKDINEEKQVVEIAKRMLLELGRSYNISNNIVSVTTSIGISIFSTLDEDLDYKTLVYRADQALYQAKERKNHYMISTSLT